jgi:hypothetical protein
MNEEQFVLLYSYSLVMGNYCTIEADNDEDENYAKSSNIATTNSFYKIQDATRI